MRESSPKVLFCSINHVFGPTPLLPTGPSEPDESFNSNLGLLGKAKGEGTSVPILLLLAPPIPNRRAPSSARSAPSSDPTTRPRYMSLPQATPLVIPVVSVWR